MKNVVFFVTIIVAHLLICLAIIIISDSTTVVEFGMNNPDIMKYIYISCAFFLPAVAIAAVAWIFIKNPS